MKAKNKFLKIVSVRLPNYIGYRLINFASNNDGSNQSFEGEIDKCDKENLYDMKRVTYPLNQDSIVVDLGGLNGDWASRIYCLYSCNIDIYEPHPVLSDWAKCNFRTNPKVRIFNFGLGNKTDTMTLYGDWVSASIYPNDAGNVHHVPIKKSSDIFNENYKTVPIDLLKINIEGAEYNVLPDLIQNFNMEHIQDIQIQFHKTVDGYSEKRDAIRVDLSETHTMNWCYDYIFENWTLKKT